MSAKHFSQSLGWCLLLLGLISLFPFFAGSSFDLPLLRIDLSYGKFLGYLPMNLTTKIILIGFGIAGIITASMKSNTEDASINYARVLFYSMGTIASCALFKDTNTFFGYMPILKGAGIFFSFLSLLGFIFGYGTHRSRLHDKRPTTHAV